jgi:hypothetical protein
MAQAFRFAHASMGVFVESNAGKPIAVGPLLGARG